MAMPRQQPSLKKIKRRPEDPARETVLPSLRELLAFCAAPVGAVIGWWLGSGGNTFTAFMGGLAGVVVGILVARRWAGDLLP